jgi:hypothetical protein
MTELRRAEVIDVVNADDTTHGDLLFGVPRARIPNEVIGGGQADFTRPWNHLTVDQMALLYAWFNQLGHIEELVEAFSQLFGDSAIEDSIVIDLGCGPFTAGLALLATFGADRRFHYVGVDRAEAMHRLGEKLALAAAGRGQTACASRQWVTSLADVRPTEPLCWKPVIVVVSYLLASPTLDAIELVREVDQLLGLLSRGPATVLYTNAPAAEANRKFPPFCAALEAAGFRLVADDMGQIEIARYGGARQRRLRYALFHRDARDTLILGGA